MKRVLVVVSGAPEESNRYEVSIEPGTTAGDVLEQLGIPRYLLQREGSGQFFANTEELYGQVDDGAKLRAATAATVGGTQ